MTKTATTHFGDREVATEEKQALVGDVFSKVAQRYDIMNDALSGGMHRLWKEKMVAALPRYSGFKLLDLAGGTGDIAFRYLSYLPNPEQVQPVTICDINADMLGEGRKRSIDRNYAPHIHWVCGNAEMLPVEDNSYDGCTIAFGIRNVTNIQQALHDIYRALKPGGIFLCLEFSPVEQDKANTGLIENIYNLYSDHLIPRLGQMIAGDAQPYQYLVQSIRRFPKPEPFAEMIRKAGFSRVSYRQMTHGVVSLHKGWKI